MALKKAPPIILQTEARTQEEWDALMQRKGLAVVDVYSQWCGPCKAIISLFRKIRNEQADDLLFFATGETDSIESLADYRGRSQPTFLFYGDGQLINVMRGCDGPMITKSIAKLMKKERQIAEGICERDVFIDKVVSKEPEAEEKEDEVKEPVNDAEEELVPKQVTVVIIKPDAVQAGHVEQISEEVVSAGCDILQKVERSLTKDEVAELYKQDEGDNFEQLIEFMTSGPCVILAVSKSGDAIGEEIVEEFVTKCGPTDVNTAKEEAPESFRAKFGTDSLRNAIGSSLSIEDAARELTFFFPDLEMPTVKHLIQQKTLQRTVALIRPNAYAEKDNIIKTIEDNGFLIAIQKEIEFSQEMAEEFCSPHKDEENYESLITTMTSGPSVALCLVKNNAIQVWKDMLVPNEVVEPIEGDVNEPEVSLQTKFAVPNSACEPLHASDSITEFEREMKILFPVENVVVVLQPDTYKNDEEKDAIMSNIKHAGFNIVVQKEIAMTNEQATMLYKEDAEKEFFGELIQYMISGRSQFLILSREDAVDGLQTLLGPAHPEKAKELCPDSLRGQFGKDEVRHAVYGSTTKDGVPGVIKEFCADIVFDENGLVCELVPGIEGSEVVIDASQPGADAAIVEPVETAASGDDVAAPEQPVAEEPAAEEPAAEEPAAEEPAAEEPAAEEPAAEEPAAEEPAAAEQADAAETADEANNEVPPADEPTNEVSAEPPVDAPTSDDPTDDSSVPPSREPTTDGTTEDPTSTEVSREGTLDEANTEAVDTTTSNTDTDTA